MAHHFTNQLTHTTRMKKKKKTVAKSVKKVAPKKKVTSKMSAPVRAKAPVMPLGDRVLLKPLSVEEMGTVSSFGIIIPETIDKEKPEQGIVVAVGPGKIGETGVRVPVAVSIGDRVVFSKYGFDEVKVGGVEYYLVSEANILAVINS